MERERAMVLAGISHDLRTPLARLRLGLEMLGHAKLDTTKIYTQVTNLASSIKSFDFELQDVITENIPLFNINNISVKGFIEYFAIQANFCTGKELEIGLLFD